MASLNTSKVDGNTVSSSEYNQLAEVNNFITNTGQTPSTTNLQQMGIGASRYSSAGQYFEDSGIANAYVLSPVSPFKSPVSSTAGEGYFSGLQITFKTANANTGASTVNINGAGVKNLKKSDGTTDLSSGEIPANQYISFIYNGTNFVKQAQTTATSTTQGINYLSLPTNLPSITINSGAPNTTLDISAGVINHDDGSAQFVVSAMSKIIQSTGSWTAGTNQNGLDTGARANSTWYQVFIIRKTSDNTSDILFSTSRTSPTIPSGYTQVAWLGAMRTNSSGNIDASYFAKRTSFGQVVSYIESNVITGSGAIPFDDTPPQNNEGAQYMELAFYPLSTTSRINTIVNWNGSANASADLTLALFKNNDTSAIRAIPWNIRGVNVTGNILLYSSEIIGSTSLQTYKVRAGGASSISLAMNGVATTSARLYGGVASSSILIYDFL